MSTYDRAGVHILSALIALLMGACASPIQPTDNHAASSTPTISMTIVTRVEGTETLVASHVIVNGVSYESDGSLAVAIQPGAVRVSVSADGYRASIPSAEAEVLNSGERWTFWLRAEGAQAPTN